MKSYASIGEKVGALNSDELIHGILYHLLAAVSGFIFSRGIVLEGILPFGLSLVAGCPQIFLPSVSVGCFLGYFIPAAGNGGFRYIAALLAILAIRIMVSGYKQVSQNSIFLSGICLSCTYLTAAVTLSGLTKSIFLFLAEGVLSAGGAFFIHKAGKGLSRRTAGLSGEELAALIISLSIGLLGLAEISLFGVSPFKISSVFLILLAARYSGILGGAISGIAFSCILTLHTPQNGYILYAIGGCVAGVVCHLGKYAPPISFLMAAVVSTAVTGNFKNFGPVLAEIILSSILFVSMPKNLVTAIGKLFLLYPKSAEQESIKKAITMRLDIAAGALCDVNETVEQVARELSKINAPEFTSVFSGAELDTCGGCKLRVHCWETKKDSTLEGIIAMTKAIKQGEINPARFATDELKGRCLRLERLSRSVYRRYSEYTSMIAAESRIEDVRNVVSEQFSGIADMLSSLSKEFEADGRLDSGAATRAAAALQDLDLIAEECCGRIDKYGRMTLEFRLKKSDTVLNRMQIMKAVSLACERDFDPPAISEIGGDLFITLNEHAAYRIDLGVGQISATDTNVCGDSYRCFKDGSGHFIAVLSDGMGTGGRAAVDGAMASGLMSRLIKSGFSYDCALKILNSSMLFKSSDESLATVDIASIDLFTGKTEIYKAGAAPTLVRRSGKTGKAVSHSLPIGILGDIGFDRAEIRLKQNDIVLMLSDGATADGTGWIREELEAWRDGSAEDLALHISDCARRRNRTERADDITVIAAIIEKAV